MIAQYSGLNDASSELDKINECMMCKINESGNNMISVLVALISSTGISWLPLFSTGCYEGNGCKRD